jgi:hypothetical protein
MEEDTAGHSSDEQLVEVFKLIDFGCAVPVDGGPQTSKSSLLNLELANKAFG